MRRVPRPRFSRAGLGSRLSLSETWGQTGSFLIFLSARIKSCRKRSVCPQVSIFLYNGRISAYLSKRIGEEKMEEAVRWSIKVSRETDLTLRTYLGARGMKKGDLSKFIEEAVRWRILSRTVRDIKARNANANVNELQGLIDGAAREVRAELRGEKRGTKKKRAKA
jgi:hypothetical protein